MLVFKSTLPSKTVCLKKKVSQFKIAVLQFFSRMHKLLILVIPGSKELHLYVIVCYLRYVNGVCIKKCQLKYCKIIIFALVYN